MLSWSEAGETGTASVDYLLIGVTAMPLQGVIANGNRARVQVTRNKDCVVSRNATQVSVLL